MKLKKIHKRICRFLGKYINGVKGVMSIFLALLVSPLFSIAAVLVEYARYQSAIEMMNELLDSSAFSTLAEYDSFLEERFGLLSASQEKEVGALFQDYLSKNVSALGQTVTLGNTASNGELPLSETTVLKQQILEYSEINVVIEALLDGFDIQER